MLLPVLFILAVITVSISLLFGAADSNQSNKTTPITGGAERLLMRQVLELENNQKANTPIALYPNIRSYSLAAQLVGHDLTVDTLQISENSCLISGKTDNPKLLSDNINRSPFVDSCSIETISMTPAGETRLTLSVSFRQGEKL